MKIRLISHACVLVETRDCKILADPWLVGRAFNESWTLFPAPRFDESMLDDVDFLWISHEHPDHFNVPTLRSFPESFRSRVTVLFQQNNSRKMFEAFERLGYSNHRALPHRKVVSLSETTEVYCYQVGQMDSCLGIRDPSGTVVNANDAYTNRFDTRRIRQDFGAPDVLLNQFSIAGYGGFEDVENHLPAMADGHLDHMVQTHEQLGAGVTIPFASFVLFSSEDNRYVNEFANSPERVNARFEKAGARVAVLALGDVYDTESSENWDSVPAIYGYASARESSRDFAFDESVVTPLEKIEEAFHSVRGKLSKTYPDVVLRLLKPVTVRVPDLGKLVRFSIADGTFEELSEPAAPDLIVNSQPLCFAFSVPFGVQTLGVSARFRIPRDGDSNNWGRHRALFGLYNAEFYLRPRYFFSASNLRFLWARRRGLLSQITTRIALMSEGR
jgi:L-ascorbate metabolism protein UlaG (beta-lactamase superfamily)